MKYFLIFILCISYVYSDEYLVNTDGRKKEYDGIGIGIVNRPSYCERTTQKGDLLKVNFNCTLADGTLLDGSHMARTFEFVLGEGQVIAGWEGGLKDMCLGETRHITIPSQYAYGDNAFGTNIPPRTTLYFFVTLVSFERVPNAPRKENTFLVIDRNNDGLLSSDEVRDYLKTVGIRDVQGQGGLGSMLDAIFSEEDRDNNGYITHPEFSGPKHTEL